MASMANRTQWLDVGRLRDNIAGNGHAMPIGLGKLFNSGVVGEKYCVSPLFAFTQGSNVPISMGSPPTVFREDE